MGYLSAVPAGADSWRASRSVRAMRQVQTRQTSSSRANQRQGAELFIELFVCLCDT